MKNTSYIVRRNGVVVFLAEVRDGDSHSKVWREAMDLAQGIYRPSGLRAA